MIRPSTDADLEAITAIYGYHVLNGAGTFELEPPALEEMRGRRASVLSSGWLWLVTCDDRSGDVLGYASANTYRPRAAYRFCVEDSIYLSPRATGRGLGKALLRVLIEQCTALGARQMVAVIGDSGNFASVKLHESFGFTHRGVLRDVGFKLGGWRDVVMMQKGLGEAASSLPAR